MKFSNEKHDTDIINVVDDFDYSTQDECYNKHFIEWRKRKNNPYAYNFTLNKKESVFVDGEGFVNKSASDAEMSTLNCILFVIEVTLLCSVIIYDVLDKVVVEILDAVGVNIHNALVSSVIYGGKAEISAILIIFTVAKFGVPLLIIHMKFKIPHHVRCPHLMNDPCEVAGTVAATLVASSIVAIPTAYSEESECIYNFFKTFNTGMSVFGQKEFIIYSIFDIVIVSIISESLFRGEMFAALRQFGDAYAVIITSVLSGIFTQNFQIMAGTIIISAVSAIGCLRSGTVFSAIIARIVYKIFLLMLTIIASSNIPHVKTVKHIYLMLVLFVGLVAMIVIFSNKERREKTIFARYKAYVPMKKKLLAAVKSIPLIVAVVSCLFVAALKLAS